MLDSMNDTSSDRRSSAGPWRALTIRILPILLAAGAWLPAQRAEAQVASTWLRGSTLNADMRPFSARLEAMGGLTISVEDPENRIDAYRYSDNPAGLFFDADSSELEQYSRYDHQRQSYYRVSHGEEGRESSVRAVVRSGRSWTLALDADLGAFNSSQHDLATGPDNGRFIRDFDLMYPNDLLGPSGDRAISAGIEAPHLGMTYSRPLLIKHLTVGGRFGFVDESESRIVPTTYSIKHELTAYQVTGGALYDLRAGRLGATAGGHIGWSSDKVEGTSESPLNQDGYDWSRPLVFYGAQAVIHYNSWLHGIIDGRHRSFDGECIARIDWAPPFYLNPLPADNQESNIFKRRWSAFLSGLRRNEGSTRWMADVKGTPVHVSGSFLQYREYEWLRTNPDVFTVARDLDVRRTGIETAGGLSVDLPRGRGLLAAEFHFARDNRTDLTGALDPIHSETVTYHFGAEYRAVHWLPLRAGLIALRDDPDRFDHEPPVKGTRLSAGVGYDWAWLGTHFDVAWGHQHMQVPPGYASQEVRTGDLVSLTARYVF
jgi:hypothetical protein